MALQYVYLLAILNMDYYHRDDPGFVNMYISGYQDTKIEYILPWEGDVRQVVLDESNDRTWEDTMQLSASEQAATDQGGIRVTSSQPITIQVSRGKLRLTNTAAYTALPLSETSKEFIISSQRSSPIGLAGSQALFTIGAGEHGAEVSVYDNKTDTPSLLFVKRLSSYEMLEVPSGQEDITGVYLKSDQPIVVYSGHQCGNVPIGASYCEPLFQQIPALPLVGTEYVMGPIMQRDRAGYTARVIVTKMSTDVVVAVRSGTVKLSYADPSRRCELRRIGDKRAYNVQCRYPLRVGNYLEFLVTPSTSPLVIKCSSPCYVYQMNHGGTQAAIGVETDPFMALVPPLGHMITRMHFSTISSFTSGRELIFRNFVSVVAPQGQKMLLDGELLSTDESYSAGDYVIYYSEIQHGFHQVRTQDDVASNIVVQVYGHGPSGTSFQGQTAYGLPAQYFGIERVDSTIDHMTTTTPMKPSPSTSTTSMWHIDDDDYHSTNTWYDDDGYSDTESHTSAITTGILAAITVVIIILVSCAIVITIVVLVLRNRRRKNSQPGLVLSSSTANAYVNPATSVACVEVGINEKAFSKPVATANAPALMASAPARSDFPAASPPKYEDVYDTIEPVYANDGIDVAVNDAGKDIYQDVEPRGVVPRGAVEPVEEAVEYEVVDEVAPPSESKTYEELGETLQSPSDSHYDSLQNHNV